MTRCKDRIAKLVGARDTKLSEVEELTRQLQESNERFVKQERQVASLAMSHDELRGERDAVSSGVGGLKAQLEVMTEHLTKQSSDMERWVGRRDAVAFEITALLNRCIPRVQRTTRAGALPTPGGGASAKGCRACVRCQRTRGRGLG